MKASFVVLNYNRKKDLLITLAKTTEFKKKFFLDYEIIVVDNNSTDGSAVAVKQHFPDIKLVESDKNIGVAGRNLGFEKSKGEYFILLDNDSHIEHGLTEAIDFLDNNPNVGILALNVTTGPYLTEDFKWNENENILGFLACGAIIRAEVYKKIGGFAKWLTVYADEFELSIRCLEAGYNIRYFKDSNVIHRASIVSRSLKRTRMLSTRNELAIAYKYFGYKKWKYIFRMYINTLKRVKVHGFKNMYYDFLGGLEFFKMRKTLEFTPVSRDVQDFFIANYTNTFPVFAFISNRLRKLIKRKTS